jgi:uncharacterized surface protein with fasciclin (FAS1) repeats
MKKYLNIYNNIVLLAMVALLSGCEVAGLKFQENEDYKYHVLDPKIDMTALEFLNLPRTDTVFRMMQKGIEYAGLADEYSKPDRTFLFLTNAAILRYETNRTVTMDCFVGKFKVNGVPATKWEDYPVETVRDLFLYHIIEGVYSYDNLTPYNTITTSLRAADNTVHLMVVNDRNSKIRINDFPEAIKPVQVRSSNIQATNGVIHALDLFIEYGVI